MVKKRSSRIVLLLIVSIFLLLVSLSVSARNPPGSGSNEDQSSGDIPLLKPGNIPSEDENAVVGYWKACYVPIGSSGGDCSALPPLEGQVPSAVDGASITSFDLRNTYQTFGDFNKNTEIAELKFVLGIQPFKITASDLVTGSNLVFSSHQGSSDSELGLKNIFENGCLYIKNIDDIEGSIEESSLSFGGSVDFSCIDVNILDRTDCSDMADYIPQFCEGVANVGANVPTEGTPIDPSVMGISGLGGCQEVDSDGKSQIRSYGRDWYDEGDLKDDFFSSSFTVDKDTKTLIDHCCGNDPEDIGAIAKDPEEESYYPNAYMCLNYTLPEHDDNLIWAEAQNAAHLYRIYTLEMSEGSFDAISNTNNWFICDAKRLLEDKYTNISYPSKTEYDSAFDVQWESNILYPPRWENGVLVGKYMGLPMPEYPASVGTHELPSEEEGFDETASSDPPGVDGEPPLQQIIDEDSFLSADYDIQGMPNIGGCDQDADGFNTPQPTPSCSAPEGPFDCSVEADNDPAIFPGAINYCIDANDDGTGQGFDCWRAPCISRPKKEPEPGDTENPLFINPRIICYDAGETSEFAECVGWDLGNCKNPEKCRREGSAITTLRDFNSFNNIPITNEKINKTNFVLRYGVSKPNLNTIITDEPQYYTFPLYTANSDVEIYNWKDYDALEFYIWFTANFELDLWIGQFNDNLNDASRDKLKSYTYPFKARIVDYAVNEPELRKWLHVVIPMSDIYSGTFEFKPDIIVLASNVARIKTLGTQVIFNNKPYSNIIGLDKITLKPNSSELPENTDNLYCSGTWPPVWLRDLDEEGTPPNTLEGTQAGASACEAIPSYGWTGTECCGDDTGNDTSMENTGMHTFKEFYADTQAGCWAGNRIGNDQTVMMLNYEIFSPAQSGEINRTCMGPTCTFELPLTESIIIKNEHSELYNLAFVGEKDNQPIYQSIGVGGMSPSDNVYLKAENVPMQALFSDGEFYGCNAAEYIEGIKSTENPGESLVNKENLLMTPNESNMCAVQSGHFCDHPDGKYGGWSAEPVKTYPGTDMIEIDDIEIPLEEEGRRISLEAKYRTNLKRGPNLVKNGGFENV